MPNSELRIDVAGHVPRSTWAVAALLVGSLIGFDPGGWAVFGPIKWTIVLTLTFTAVAFATSRGSLPLDQASVVTWAIFLGWGTVVSLAAVDPLYTWLGTPDRHLGLLAWLVFALLFFLGQSINDEASIRLILRAATVAMIGIGLYALLELFDAAPVDLALTADRLGGSFGSPAYLGAACALLLPVLAGSIVDGLGSLAWRIAIGVGITLGVVAVVGSQTRAAWVGLVVAGVFVLPALWDWLHSTRWIPGLVVVVGVVIVVMTPLGDRARALLDPDDPGARGRIDEWQVAVALIGSRPVLGAGFEGHRIVFPEEVDADYERRYTRRVMPDRAHNGALDVGVTTGLPGLLLYLVAVVWLLRRAIRAIRSKQPWLIGISGGVVAYLAQQQFLFPLAEVDPAFWILAGMLVAATSSGAGRFDVGRIRFASYVAAALALVSFGTGVLDITADHQARSALVSSSNGDHMAALEHADRASSLRPDSIRYPFLAGIVAATPGTPDSIDIAIARLDDSLAISPQDPTLRARKATYLLDRARLTGDAQHLTVAIDAWVELASFDPNNAQFQLQTGVAMALARDAQGAEEAWLRAEDLAPRSAVPATNLTALYLGAAEFDAAISALNRGLAIDPDSPVLNELAIQLASAIAGTGS